MHWLPASQPRTRMRAVGKSSFHAVPRSTSAARALPGRPDLICVKLLLPLAASHTLKLVSSGEAVHSSAMRGDFSTAAGAASTRVALALGSGDCAPGVADAEGVSWPPPPPQAANANKHTTAIQFFCHIIRLLACCQTVRSPQGVRLDMRQAAGRR